MNTYNHCLGQQVQSFSHCISDVVHVSNILEIFIQFLNFVTFNWEFFNVNWEKRYYFQLGIWPNIGYKISQKNPGIWSLRRHMLLFLLCFYFQCKVPMTFGAVTSKCRKSPQSLEAVTGTSMLWLTQG